ncbi:MAG: hypothetical protein V8R75_13825 [Oscillospiraceae bacterium]
MDKEFHGSYDIWGGDIDPAAVELSRHDAALAGVEDCVRFEVADAGKFHRESAYGQLVTNPPYGERLLEKTEAEALVPPLRGRGADPAGGVESRGPLLPHGI